MKLDRVIVEDTLKQVHALAGHDETVSVEALAHTLQRSTDSVYDILSELMQAGLLRNSGARWQLTEDGRAYAREVIRAHRLYETYLAYHTGEEPAHWHRRADIEEHKLTPEAVDRLAARLLHPRYDPHGDPIPTKSGMLPEHAFVPLSACNPGMVGRITHIEDEPDEPYARLMKLKLAPGMKLRYVELKDGKFFISVAGRVLTLDLAMAGSLCVERIDEAEVAGENLCRLSDLNPGEEAVCVSLSPACMGTERRRLLDMGLVAGSRISLEMRGAFRSPVAYRVRNAVIALREEQSDYVLIRKEISAK